MRCGITENEVTLIDLGSGRLKCPDCCLVLREDTLELDADDMAITADDER